MLPINQFTTFRTFLCTLPKDKNKKVKVTHIRIYIRVSRFFFLQSYGVLDSII